MSKQTKPALVPSPHALRELAAARDPNVPHALHHDVESRSRIDLRAVGAHRYAKDPSTEVLVLAYAVDNEPVQIWTPGDPVPTEFIEAATNSNWITVAHNDQFERLIFQHILEPRHGFPHIPIGHRRCSMAMACAAALPASLEKLAAALRLPHVKDKAGAALMKRMAKPKRDGTWIEDPASLERLYAYCRKDVEAERAAYRVLPLLIPAEQELWQLDAAINERGFHVDQDLLDAAHGVIAKVEAKLQAEFHSLTGLKSTNQTDKFVAWLGARCCEVANVQKRTLRQALRRTGLEPPVRRAIELRLKLAHASAAKVAALRAWRGADNRVRGAFRYHGASPGRWTSIGIQVQNLKRDGAGINAKITAVMNGGLGLASPVEAVGDIARAFICAAPGHRFLIGDFSGIESRVLAFLSGQESKLAQWRAFDASGALEDNPYYVLGRSCGLPESMAYIIGKIIDLAFGFMGGVGAWEKLAPEDDATDEATIKRYQQAWRDAHPRTVDFWYEIDRAAIAAVQRPDVVVASGRFTLTLDAPFLRITLPSGRTLSYPFPRLGVGKFGDPIVIYKDNAEGKWVDCRFGQGAYGGIWTENVVQAGARDLLAAAMLRLEAAGYHVVLHVHDEVVVEVPDGFGSLEEFQRLLTMVPEWANGLPLAAKVRAGLRFSKPDGDSAIPDDFAGEVDVGGGAHDDDDLSDVRTEWTTPSTGEVPPGSPEFAEVLAALDPGDCTIEPSNGRDCPFFAVTP
jgi:DNA polymerase